jgi:hypothetical protein
MPREAPDARSTPRRGPSDEHVLAAVERAARHRPDGLDAVPARAVLEHLDLHARSAAARVLRRRLRELLAVGQLERSRRHGVEVWALAGAGRARLGEARRRGRPPALPESPQRRAWRAARTAAALETARFHRRLGGLLEETALLLAADPPPRSDAWLELAERLRHEARCVGSATYCLHEWQEPDDRRADVDDGHDPSDGALPCGRRARLRALRAGRRNTRLWRDRA